MKKKSIAAEASTLKKLSAISTNVNAKPSRFNSKAVHVQSKRSDGGGATVGR